MAYKKIVLPQFFLGASTDDKPTTVNVGSRCFELDAMGWYITGDGVNWSLDKHQGIRAGFGRASLVEDLITRDIKGRAFIGAGFLRRNPCPSWGK